MSIQSILIGLGVALAAPAVAQAPSAAPISMAPGEELRAEVRGDGPMAVVLSRGDAAPLSAFDNAAVRHMMGPAGKEAVGDNAIPLNANELGTDQPSPVAPNQVRIVFVLVQGGEHSLLIVENGYDRGLTYRARIHARGQVQPTDVCLVMPGRGGYEHWPYPIDRIDLSELRLQPWEPSQGIHCE